MNTSYNMEILMTYKVMSFIGQILNRLSKYTVESAISIPGYSQNFTGPGPVLSRGLDQLISRVHKLVYISVINILFNWFPRFVHIANS